MKRMTANLPAIEAHGSGNALERTPIETARAVLLHAEMHGATEFYVDGQGAVYLRRSVVRYADDLPTLWLVGTYTAESGAVRIVEDLEIRLVEVRASRG